MRRTFVVAFGILVMAVSFGVLVGVGNLNVDKLIKSSRNMYLGNFSNTRWKTDGRILFAHNNSTDSVDNFHCAEKYNSNLYIHLRLRPGRTGSSLFQINCLLALTRKFCYKAIIESSSKFFSQSIHPFFDLAHIELHETVNNATFHQLFSVLSKATQRELSYHRYNWTLKDACYGHNYIVGQEQYVRSSIKLKEVITRVIDEYISFLFANRSTVAIHVRRTDRINSFGTSYEYRSLKWYIPFISKAMSYLRSRHSDLAFIFVSDDIKWCMNKFKDQDVYYSPFLSAGYDLALIARCDHMIFTLGGFAWHGAWLGKKKTVIYSKDYLPGRYATPGFQYPWWTGI